MTYSADDPQWVLRASRTLYREPIFRLPTPTFVPAASDAAPEPIPLAAAWVDHEVGLQGGRPAERIVRREEDTGISTVTAHRFIEPSPR